MKKIDYCIVVSIDMFDVERGTDKWYNLYDILSKMVKEQLYKGKALDICSMDLCWENGNLVFAYKAVPASAPTMSSYPHYHALIIHDGNLIRTKEE
jgi:hypothetical protein